MYDNKNLIYIFTILGCIEKCWIYTKDFNEPLEFIFANQQKDLNAVISMFIAIGEESKKIEEKLKDDISTQISWKAVAGIRDKISHSYRGVDEKLLWNTIQKDLYVIQEAMMEMIRLINPSQEILNDFFDSKYYKHIFYLKQKL